MARKRYVTSEISVDERLAEIASEDPQSALMWPWFLLVFDDWGRAEMNAMKIRLQLFPAFPFLVADIERAVEAFSSKGLVFFYEIDGVRYGAIRPRTWLRYQVYLKGTKRSTASSSVPPPPKGVWDADEAMMTADMTRKSEKSADKPAVRYCQLTSADAKRCQEMAVPSPSLEPKVKVSCPADAGRDADPSPRGEGDHESFGDEKEARKVWENGTKESFERTFWARYPRKDKKADALKAFRQVFPFRQRPKEKERRWRNLQEHLWAALDEFAEREDVKYIPLPGSWIRAVDFDSPPEDSKVPESRPMFRLLEGGAANG